MLIGLLRIRHNAVIITCSLPVQMAAGGKASANWVRSDSQRDSHGHDRENRMKTVESISQEAMILAVRGLEVDIGHRSEPRIA